MRINLTDNHLNNKNINSYNRLSKPKYEQLGQFEDLVFTCFKKGVFGGPVDKKTK